MSASPIAQELIGHEQAVEQITAAFQSGRMHHAWLMVGMDGIGKTSLAWHIANHVLSKGKNPVGKYNPHDRVTKLIQAEAHPDMLVIRRSIDEKTGERRNIIPVDDVLKVASFLRKTSTHGGWRVVIIDEAHRMNRNGENAILKILEEPPAHALILITATTPGALLPTIRSRCRVLNLSSLNNAQMKTILMRSAPDMPNEEIENLISISGGSIGFALKIVQTESLPLIAEMQHILTALPSLDMPRLHKLADQISRKADAESFEIIRSLLQDRIRLAALQATQTDANRHTIENYLQTLDKLSSLFNTADHAHLDRKLAFIQAIGEVRSAGI